MKFVTLVQNKSLNSWAFGVDCRSVLLLAVDVCLFFSLALDADATGFSR
jgi:hypothetical protein